MKGRESGMPDSSAWETFFNPRCILERLDCRDSRGDVVEFGCGYGTFTLPAAEMAQGQIHALDIDPKMVEATAQKALEGGLRNIVAVQRDFSAAGSGQPDESCGYAMLFNILHIEDPVGLLREAFRVLTRGSKAAIIHWRMDVATPRGPSPDIRPSPEACREWGERAGFEFVRYESLCCCSWHWGLLLRRP